MHKKTFLISTLATFPLMTHAADLTLGLGADTQGTGTATSYTSWNALGVNNTATSYTGQISGTVGVESFTVDVTISVLGHTSNISENSSKLKLAGGNFSTGQGFTVTVGTPDNLNVFFAGFHQSSTGNTGGSEGLTINGDDYVASVQTLSPSPQSSFSALAIGTVDVRYVDLVFTDTPVDSTPPAIPTGIAATAGTAQISLDWDDNAEADLNEYRIYRKENGGDFTLIGSSSTSDFIDTSTFTAIPYTYTVTAVDNAENESAISAEVSETPILDAIPPAAVTVSIVSSQNGQVSLDWSDSPDFDFKRYEVYRETDASAFQLLTSITTLESSNYNDAGLIADASYSYKIVVVDTSENSSADSNTVTTTPEVPTATPVKDLAQDQLDPVEVLGYSDLTDSSGEHFETYIGIPFQAATDSDYQLDYDGDTQNDLQEYKLGSDADDAQKVVTTTLEVAEGSTPTFTFSQRLSSPSAYAKVLWSTDLSRWHSNDIVEISRTAQPDGDTEAITLVFNDPSITDKVFVRIETGKEDYVASFIQPPAARHATAISMTARKAAFDPRTVEYYFECTSGNGNDSGWQRSRLFIDAGTRTGDTPLTEQTSYNYRVKTRRLTAPAVAGDPSTLIPDSESEWSREISVTTPAANTVEGSRPNVIVFMCDDLGWEAFDIYGDSNHNTPRLTEMANEGIRFTHFYSQPLCTPSRVQIMSGRYAQRNYTGFDEFLQNTSFGNFFQNAGYQTAIAGKWQLDDSTLNGISRKDPRVPHWQGFDEYLLWHFAMNNDSLGIGSRYWNPFLRLSLNTSEPSKPNYLDAAAMARDNATIPDANNLDTTSEWNALDTGTPDLGTSIDGTDYGPDLINNFINEFALEANNEGDNFFIYCPLILPHDPWPNPPTIDPNDPKGTQHTGGNPRYTMTEYMDYLVGKTLDMIRNHPDPNVSQNTLVIFTADNGTNTGITSQFNGASYKGAKRETRNGGNHVPCIAWWGGENGKIPTGQVSHDVVDISDILATICDGAGVPIWRPASISSEEYIHDSHSFCSTLFGRNRDPRRWSFGRWEGKSNDDSTSIRWARNTRYKLYHPNGKNEGSNKTDDVDRSGKFFDFVATPFERVPGGEYTVDDSLPTPTPGSNLEAIKNELQAVLDLHEVDIYYDTN